MKDLLIKHFYILFFFYAYFIGSDYQLDKESNLEQTKQVAVSFESRLKRKQKELRDVKKFEKNLEESKNKVKEVIEKIATTQKQLPSEINDTEIQSTLSAFGDELKIQNTAVSPRKETNNGFYFTKEYNVDARGTFLQFLIFYERIEKLATDNRIMNIKYLKMTVDENSDPRSRFQILNLNTVIESYRYNANYNPQDG